MNTNTTIDQDYIKPHIRLKVQEAYDLEQFQHDIACMLEVEQQSAYIKRDILSARVEVK